MAGKTIQAAEVCKKYNVASSTLVHAINRGDLQSVKEGKFVFLDEDEVVEWCKTRRRRNVKKGRKPKSMPESFQRSSYGKSNNSIFISLLMKIVGELSKIENGLSGQAKDTVDRIKEEIVRTVRGVDL